METSESLRRLVLEYYAAANSHDEVALKERSALVPEASMIGTDASEWFLGADAVQAAFHHQFLEFGEIVFEPGEVLASEHGDTGWFVDRPTIVWGDQRTTGRCSGTAVRIDGQWLLVQTHMSLPQEG
jgi:hypothetical protein